MKVTLEGRTQEYERRRGVKIELVLEQEVNKQLRALKVRHVEK